MQGQNTIVPKETEKRHSNVTRLSKKSQDVPSYPSIEDVLRNNRSKKKTQYKENYED